MNSAAPRVHELPRITEWPVIQTIQNQYVKARLEQFRTGVGNMRFRATIHTADRVTGHVMVNKKQIPVTYSPVNGWSVKHDWQTKQLSLF